MTQSSYLDDTGARLASVSMASAFSSGAAVGFCTTFLFLLLFFLPSTFLDYRNFRAMGGYFFHTL